MHIIKLNDSKLILILKFLSVIMAAKWNLEIKIGRIITQIKDFKLLCSKSCVKLIIAVK